MDIKNTDLSETAADLAVQVWIGRNDEMKRIPGVLDNAVIFAHLRGTPDLDWRMVTLDGIDASVVLGLIDALQRWCKERGIAAAEPKLAAPRENVLKSGEQRIVRIPMPEGTTPEQAKQIESTLREKIGQPKGPPKPGSIPL